MSFDFFSDGSDVSWEGESEVEEYYDEYYGEGYYEEHMEDYYDADPWRFPFCDLFLYRYEKSNEKFEFKRKQARLWWPNNFYDASLASVNGTYLKKFGVSQFRF
mgnify:CR=1 FL=1